MWSLKPEWWGSLLVQEKYQEEKACDKRHTYLIIIIIIIIINIMLIQPRQKFLEFSDPVSHLVTGDNQHILTANPTEQKQLPSHLMQLYS